MYSLGFDFGTESVRVVIVDTRTGQLRGAAVRPYPRGVITENLPAEYALQDPRDWISASSQACREALQSSQIPPEQIIGIGVDFTSCTMLPTRADGVPLCLLDEFKNEPHAWPKLWKHHGAKAEAERITNVAQERKEKWLARYGGTISLEWFFPKILETIHHAPRVHEAADVWLEAGDWFVWQLIGATGEPGRPRPGSIPQLTRSTCQAGYKAMWNTHDGYPSRDYFAAVDPKLADVGKKLPGDFKSPGCTAGSLSHESAGLFGLKEGTPVSTAIIDAHSGVPGAGVAEPGTLVMVLGTSSCHMLNSKTEKLAPGIAGVVEGGILPGFFGYEAGQASVGDAFAWLIKTFHLSHAEMTQRAANLSPGSNGVIALDWLNGCRTPLMDACVSGGFLGITLATKPEQLYRALIESTAFGVRWIVDTLRDAGVDVNKFVASGGLPAKSPLLMQIYSDVLNQPIYLAESDQSVALGAAILGAIASGKIDMPTAIHNMARQRSDIIYHPDNSANAKYEQLYPLYRSLTDSRGKVVDVMRKLRNIA